MIKTLGVGAFVALLVLAPIGTSGGVLPVNPVVNGDFELAVSPGGSSALNPYLDTCHGIGHQVFYGSESVPHALLNGNAEGAAGYATDPDHVMRYAGVTDSCVYGDEDGYDLVWLNPAEKSTDPAFHWSHQDAATFSDVDANGDREATIFGNAGASNHNFWQAYPSPFQAWTPDADAFTFTIENHDAFELERGLVLVSLSATPVGTQSPYAGLWLDCQLAFTTSMMNAHMDADGVVAIPPTSGDFTSRDPGCDHLKAAWDAGDDDAKARVLASTRIVQLSFWQFNHNAADVVIDDVAFVNAKTAAEGAPGATVCPYQAETELVATDDCAIA